jgi:hypothetical protein
MLSDEILDILNHRERHAALVTEVAAVLRLPTHELDAPLQELERARQVVVTDHPAPDVHLTSTDLRIVAQVPADGDALAAQEASEELWNRWLQMFLSTHRCQ